MVKILSQTGISLADTYDVEGSIAGIEQLNSEDVSLVHDMGSTIFSERLSGNIRRRATAALSQNANVDEVINDLPSGPTRILGVSVLADVTGRVLNLAVMLRDPVAGRETPIWLFDGTNDEPIRIVDNGSTVVVRILETETGYPTTPTMLIGSGQPNTVPDIAMRGRIAAFGAGTVTLTLLVYLGFSQVGGISSTGLPVPSW